MSPKSPQGQALPEYLLAVSLLVLLAYAGLQAWRLALDEAEQEQAWIYSLPSP
jgi:hypothetical protein